VGGIGAIGEIADARATKLTLELATLAMELAAGSGSAATVVLIGADQDAASACAALGPGVMVSATARSDAVGAALIAAELIAEHAPDVVLIGATPDGKDIAGTLLALTDLPILVAAAGVAVVEDAVEVEMGIFGGRTITSSTFVGGRGIVLVRPGVAEPALAPAPGTVTEVVVEPTDALPAVTLVERVVAPAAGPSIDDASIIVGAGRGVDGPAGIALVEELAAELGGAVGATRAAVDAGWIDFAQQIGQTGKTVKPDLYLAAGVSGAIQHRVGVQNVGTIVTIEKDRDAPITEFADLVVVGDLFEILPRLSTAVRAAKANH